MENINIKKIECLNFEKIELEKLIKDIVNNHETIYYDSIKATLINNQTYKINDLEHHLKRLRSVYHDLSCHYPPKFHQNISEK